MHPQSSIRAGSIKVIRHLINTVNDVSTFNQMQLPLLVCRSLDIMLRNEEERMQALKLIRKVLIISPKTLSPAIVNCLVSLAEGGKEDRTLKAILAVLCEVGLLNPDLLVKCGGIKVLTLNVLETHSPRITESLCGVLLHYLEWPQHRIVADIRLECFAAPYCDFTYRIGMLNNNKYDFLFLECKEKALLT